MNLKEAIDRIKSRGQYIEEISPNKYLILWNKKQRHDYTEDMLYNPREVIKYVKNCLVTHPGYRIVKELTHKPIRRIVRQKIKKEDFDNISGEKKRSKNNPWNFD